MAERSTRFSHATLREIYEQPSALADTFRAYTQGEGLRDEMWAPISDVMSRRDRLVIAASGSSRHAGMLGEIMMEEF